MTSPARFVLRFPDLCCAQTVRNGELQPCHRPAVAAAKSIDGDPGWWPICKRHIRDRSDREIVPLQDLLTAARKGLNHV